VMKDQNLAVAARASTNPNGWSADFIGDHFSHFARNSLEENASHAGAIESSGIAHELLDVGEGFALHLEPAHPIERLRRQTNVASYGNLGVDHMANDIDPLFAAFNLHNLSPAFFHE